VLRNGLGAEGLTWSIMFLFLPLTCVYYPVATLPVWLQYISWACRRPRCSRACGRWSWRDVPGRPDALGAGLNLFWISLAGWGFMKLMHALEAHGLAFERRGIAVP
jgi:ABC-2 type transport system permease protein